MTNPLTDVLPAKARKVLYAILFVVALGFAAWETADGDWLKALGLLVTSLLGGLAASNTPSPEVVEFDEIDHGAH